MIKNSTDLILESVSVLYGTNMVCTYHWRKLDKVPANINYYDKVGKKKKLLGTIKRNVHICGECGTAFITRSDFEAIKIDTEGYYINFKGNIHHTSRNIKNDLDENIINNYELTTLGYTTDISRNNRWKILINKIIPQIGLYNTMEQIKNFINYNVMAKGKEKALIEWQFDLERLENLDMYENIIEQKL